MELLGRIDRRKIYYLQIRNNTDWKFNLPNKDWLAFTIANTEDEELIPPVAKNCIDKNVSYICSTGNLANRSEDYFDEEISLRAIDFEMETNKKFDYELSPVTTAHKNFGEGFWFASKLANDENFEIEKIVCLDMTKRKVKNHLLKLIDQINNGFLPNEKETELPEYDI